jgi:Reverse transcriptase (RNA-dependent DNA polymerase)
VFSIKQTPERKVEWYKIQLVAKGYSQTYGIDFDEIFVIIVKMSMIQTLTSEVVNKYWELHQLDVKNIFLYGDL